MKKIKLILLIAIFSILGSILKAQANAYIWPQITSGEEFKNMGDGKCVYYLTGGCGYGGWYSYDDKGKCNWEPCCKYKMEGYSDYEYMFKKNCNGGKSIYGEESEEPDKSKCLGTGLSCCCLTRPPSTSATPAPTFTPIKIISPNIQVPIPGLTLTPADSIQPTENSNGSFSLNIPWISEYIIGIYNYGVSVAGILAAIILMAGGALWLVSAGDASKITQAKELITGSVTGLIILMSSYLILYTISPELTIFKSISLGTIQHEDFKLVESKLGSTAETYKKMGCPSADEFAAGIEIYATGYFKMPWQDNQDLRYLCMVHMQGTCPNGTDTNQRCTIFPDYPDYQPCSKFTQSEYDKYFKGFDWKNNTIAGPICSVGDFAKGKQVCFSGKTYTITDSGGGIQGRRIDILSESEKAAINNTKVGTLKSGACK